MKVTNACADNAAQESGHFECNGFAAKLESKSLNILIGGDAIKITYSAGMFTPTEISNIVECITEINSIVMKSNMEKV